MGPPSVGTRENRRGEQRGPKGQRVGPRDGPRTNPEPGPPVTQLADTTGVGLRGHSFALTPAMAFSWASGRSGAVGGSGKDRTGRHLVLPGSHRAPRGGRPLPLWSRNIWSGRPVDPPLGGQTRFCSSNRETHEFRQGHNFRRRCLRNRRNQLLPGVRFWSSARSTVAPTGMEVELPPTVVGPQPTAVGLQPTAVGCN